MSRRKWGHDVHKYVRTEFNSRKGGTTILWRCALPNCKHYMVGVMVLHQLCLCNRCGNEVFEMKTAHLSLKKPHCLSCTKRYLNRKREEQEADISVIAANLEQLLKVE